MINVANGIKQRLAAINGSLALLAYLVGVSKSMLSESCNGVTDLSAPVALRCDMMLKDLEELTASYSPARLDLRDGRKTEELLENFKMKKARAKKAAEASVRDDAWLLLREICTSEPDAICKSHGWTRTILSEKLDAAHAQLQTETAALTAARQAFSGPGQGTEFNTF